MNTPPSRYWSFFFFLTALEGIIACFWLAAIPADGSGGFLFGFSLQRLALLLAMLLISLGCLGAGCVALRRGIWLEKWLTPKGSPWLHRGLFAALLLVALGSEVLFFTLWSSSEGGHSPLFIRALPVLLFIFIATIQIAGFILFHLMREDKTRLLRAALVGTLCWLGITCLLGWSFSPSGQAFIRTQWYIWTFSPARTMRHGADFCSPDYREDPGFQYRRAIGARKALEKVDHQKALLAIFTRVTRGAASNTEKHLQLLQFIQQSTIHASSVAAYSENEWVYDPLVLLELGNMLCTQADMIAMDLFGAAGYPSRLVQLGQHQIAEIIYDGSWHYFDPDLFGNGQTVRNSAGEIPSVAEMSRLQPQALDALAAYQELSVMDCSEENVSGFYYPSYFYFSSQAYPANAPQGYFVGSAEQYGYYDMRKVESIPSLDIIQLQEFSAQHVPEKPHITGIQVSGNTLSIQFSSQDEDGDLAGFQVFISNHTRGWDYNQFYGPVSAKGYWANPAGWEAAMYPRLFELPGAEVKLLTLPPDENEALLTLEPGKTYFISISAFDRYGVGVGRQLFAASNELKVTIP